jgi:hypothetical protein
MTDDGDESSVGRTIFVREKRSSGKHPNAEDIEVIAGNELAVNGMGVTVPHRYTEIGPLPS